ncbi:pyridine nucleotide-disulfide oxidoreductase [Streptomyces sp. SID10853]|uniref:FAD-dependent monooxygenase n=1 Tax=Streptomyces sp. SID10853 TaxID=2706028 RepID=UPI0013BFB0D1|nr:FAD-dependent monooxygenase [Streptomyces sp. SID10853]NDZ78153.1 pyridine nucleotide-disulfide oxidoreductase [Streptomyces sp. SID10853]
MLDIAIIGAGPCGLATALRLHQQGFRPRIYEAVPELRPLGVGIDVKVYGTREMDELGLLDEFREISVDADESIFFNNHGQEIYAEKCGVHMGYAHEQRFVHRGTFQMFLYRKVLERLGDDAVVLGVRTTGYTQDTDGVTLQVEHADGTGGQVRADVVIAADGINSVVRRQMHPQSAEPKYSGLTMWRGTTLMEPFKTGGTILHIGDPRVSSLIVYPIENDFEGTGLTLVNWVAEATRGESTEDWNQKGSVDEILPYYDDCRIDFIDVRQMLSDAREVYLFPLIDHDPLDSWVDGRVVLVGDAAHAMYPRGGNGACQAIVDTRVVAEKLATVPGPHEALLAFEAERLEGVNRIVMANRGEGYEVIRRMVAERTDGKRFDDIEKVLPLAEADEIFSKYHQLVGQRRTDAGGKPMAGFRTSAAESA